MSPRRKQAKASRRWLGSFRLPDGVVCTGDLKIGPSRTLLTIYSETELPLIDSVPCIQGTAFTGEKLTVIDGFVIGSVTKSDGSSRFEIDPLFVLVGRVHIDPDDPCITSIAFSSGDLAQLFHDHDAFGSAFDSGHLMSAVLARRGHDRPVELGDHPEIHYFTGAHRIAQVDTSIGLVVVDHRPRTRLAGVDGISVENRIVVTLSPKGPVSFPEAMERTHDLAVFLSVAAGRVQELGPIEVGLTATDDSPPVMLEVHPRFAWPGGPAPTGGAPDWRDLPIDSIRRRDEFARVLSSWISGNATSRNARYRLLSCMGKGNLYDVDRLVAAANLFDLLPANPESPQPPLPDALLTARDQCRRIFRALEDSPDRDAVLGALGRVGTPTLRTRVLDRERILKSAFEARFAGLESVLIEAIRMRNFFVHGPLDDYRFERLEPFMGFLTDALEFVCAASELIMAGWDAKSWDNQVVGHGHPFALFRHAYGPRRADLLTALTPR